MTARVRIAALLAAAAPALLLPAAARAAAVPSSNWSGYAVQPIKGGASGFSSVSGIWRQPTATCTAGRESYVGIWVGLGGFSQRSRALEQIGVDSDCTAAGQPLYTTWLELVPAAPDTIRLSVHRGDEMAASVTVRGRAVTLRIRDLTRGARFTKTVRASTVDTSSAEWIVEAPSTCFPTGACATLPLTDFGTASFLGATATAAGHTGAISDPLWSPTELELRQSSVPVRHGRSRLGGGPVGSLLTAVPSGLGEGGAFSVTYAEEQPPVLVPAEPEPRGPFGGAVLRQA